MCGSYNCPICNGDNDDYLDYMYSKRPEDEKHLSMDEWIEKYSVPR